MKQFPAFFKQHGRMQCAGIEGAGVLTNVRARLDGVRKPGGVLLNGRAWLEPCRNACCTIAALAAEGHVETSTRSRFYRNEYVFRYREYLGTSFAIPE